MATIFSLKEIEFKTKSTTLEMFSWASSPRLAQLAGSKQLQFDVRSLNPGKFSFPYHFHRVAEELFVILEGEAVLRSPEGFKTVRKGDILFFEPGLSGAHQLYNAGDEPCVYLDLRTATGVDVCEYPDSGKINILPYQEIYQTKDQVEYFEGEEEVKAHWPSEYFR